jgi:hypothetical protein
MPKDLLSRLKSELEKTEGAYGKVVSLRAKKIEQDREQIGVYLDILQSEISDIKINAKNSKKIDKVLSWKPKHKSCRKQQDELENHLLELQKLLVSLISKRFKY